MAAGCSPLCVCFFVSSMIVVVGNELGFDCTVRGGVAAEQAGNGLDPQSPLLPEKLLSPNF